MARVERQQNPGPIHIELLSNEVRFQALFGKNISTVAPK
jgi:hypothetical protein